MTDGVQPTQELDASTDESTESDDQSQVDETFTNDDQTALDDESSTDGDQQDDGDQDNDESQEGDATGDQEQQTVELAVDDIAAALGIESDTFEVTDKGEMLIRSNVDGKVQPVTLKDMLDSYQIRGHLDNKGKEVNKLKTELVDQQKQHQQQYSEKLQTADDLITMALQDLEKEFADVDWDNLREMDEGSYAAKRMMFNESRQNLGQRLEDVRKAREESMTEQVTAMTQEANEKLVEAFPTWADVEVGKREMGELRDYATDVIGMDKNVSAAVSDHRIFTLLSKAKQFDALQKSKPEVTKLVKRVVKATPSGKQKQADLSELSNEDVFYGTN